MKGVIFTEFLEMVEETFSPEIADSIIAESDLASEGAYTAVGNYDHQEMLRLVASLSRVTGMAADDLQMALGQHLFRHFTTYYPEFFAGIDDALTFLSTIEHHVHSEVKKLYPDAELPHFGIARPAPDTLTMTYQSPRPFGMVARGLIQGCCDHFGERVEIEAEDLSEGAMTNVRFTIRSR